MEYVHVFTKLKTYEQMYGFYVTVENVYGKNEISRVERYMK